MALTRGLRIRLWQSLALLFARFGSRHQFGDEARLGKGSDVDLRRPIFGLETAGPAIALRDGLHRMLPQALVIGGKAHRHMTADIDRNCGDITGGVGEQPPESGHRRGQFVLLEKWDAILRYEYAALVQTALAA